MKPEAIREHWNRLANEYGANYLATTKSPTIKELEIDALIRNISKLDLRPGSQILEVGCGNGLNCIALAEAFPECIIVGIDYIEQMVINANHAKKQFDLGDRVSFFTGNVLELGSLDIQYDVILTDRCLINLHERLLQDQALKQIIDRTMINGHIVLIENFNEGYSKQNEIRESVGLKRRTPDEYNLFFNEKELMESLSEDTKLITKEYFASLHDLILYVLIPMTTGGTVDYQHPWIATTTEMMLKMPEHLRGEFGAFGQNCLYVFKKVQF